MSSPVAKTLKKLSPRSSSRRGATASSPRKQSAAKTTRLKPATKRSPAGKARAHKAPKTVATKLKPKSVSVAKKIVKKPSAPHNLAVKSDPSKAARSRAASSKGKTTQIKPELILKRPIVPPPPPQPTRDEAAALKAFEAAHKEFSRGHFAEARSLFRTLVEKYPTVSEVTARARTYLAVADARLRNELALPRDADSLYDRGVIELNRGDYVAAQELFERALRREPEAAHIHYGLAASRARLGAIDTALKSLERALDLQPSLRIRAQRDQDLNPLRSDPEFEHLVFAIRE